MGDALRPLHGRILCLPGAGCSERTLSAEDQMVHIEHLALWTHRLETLKVFYQTHFGVAASPKYTNPRTGFESYFLTFDSGARLEIMTSPNVVRPVGQPGNFQPGYAHLALSVGSQEQVVALTRKLDAAGVPVIHPPRTTGDGYFESVVLDPDGNRIEITV